MCSLVGKLQEALVIPREVSFRYLLLVLLAESWWSELSQLLAVKPMKTTMQFLKHSTLTLLGLGLVTSSAHAISIVPTNDGNKLSSTILGSGINVVPGSVTYTGTSNSSGTFTDGSSSGISLDSGIILTSGTATNASGPNDSDSKGINNGLAGDSDLDTLVDSSTFNASVLEFDFTSLGGDVFFNYVFASEEYNEFANSAVNDVFGFFLDDKNIALIPGTNTPVAINTVNGGNPLGTNSKNSALFNNNDPSDGEAPFDTQYDGFTDVFTAEALNLSPGEHHIKLAVADTGDTIYDSAVFIQSGTFSSKPQPVPEPSSILGTLAFGALGAGLMLKRRHRKKVAG